VRLKVLLVVIAVVAVGIAAYVLFVPAAGSGSGAQFLTAAATVQDVLDQAVATGTVSASVTYGLGFGRDAALVPTGAALSGATSAGPWTVTALNVDVGARVKQGTVLATTSGDAAQLAVATAQAALDAANAKLAKDRAKPTADDTAHAQTVLQQAQLALGDSTVDIRAGIEKQAPASFKAGIDQNPIVDCYDPLVAPSPGDPATGSGQHVSTNASQPFPFYGWIKVTDKGGKA